MFRNAHLAAILAVGYLFMVATIVIAAVNLPGVSQRLVLHWSVVRGLDVFGTAHEVWNVVAIGAFLTVLSTLLAGAAYDRLRVLSFVFSYLTVWANVLLLVAW